MLIALVSLPTISIKGRNRLKTIGIVQVIELATVCAPKAGIINSINPNPINVTSPISKRVSQLTLSLIKGQIELSIAAKVGKAIKITTKALVSA